MKKALKFILSFIVSGAFLYLALRNTDLAGLGGALSRTHFGWMALSLICSAAVNVILASWQWHIFLKHLGLPLSFKENIFIKCSLYPLRLIFPAKSGDLARALYLNSQHGFPHYLGVSSTFFVTGTNMGVLLLMGFAGSMLNRGKPAAIALATGIGTLICIGVLIAARQIKTPPSEIPEGGKLAALFAKLTASARISFPGVMKVTGAGALALTLHLFTFYFILRALGIELPIKALFIFTPLVLIAGNLPGTVMGIGAREASVVTFLASYGTPDTLAASGLLMTFADKLLSVAVGAFMFPEFARRSFEKTAADKGGPENAITQ